MNAILFLLSLWCMVSFCKAVSFGRIARNRGNNSSSRSLLKSTSDNQMECSVNVSSCLRPFGLTCGDPGTLCSCDKLCLVYNDCCEDFKSLCPVTLEAGLEEYGHLVGRNVVCEENSKVKFLADCPALNPSPHRDACLEGANNFRHDRLPVTDAKTGISFLNAHCTLCNGVVEDDLEPWNTVLSFGTWPDSRMPAISDLPSTIERTLNSSQEAFREGMGWKWLPKTAHWKRYCIPGAIASCPSEDHPLAEVCSSFTSYVAGVDKNGYVFQNRHCLHCHGQKHCRLPTTSFFGKNIDELSVLMDFQKAGLSQVSLINDALVKSWERLTCALQDGRLGKCEIQECHYFYDLVNNSCLEKVRLVCLMLSVALFPEGVRQSGFESNISTAANALETDNPIIDFLQTTSDTSNSNDSRVVTPPPDPALDNSFLVQAIQSRLPLEVAIEWNAVLPLVEQVALAAYPASQLVNSTVVLDPEDSLVSLLAINLTSRVESPFSGLNSTLSSLQPSLIAHLQTIGFHGNASLCLDVHSNRLRIDNCPGFIVLDVPKKTAGTLDGEGSPRPGRGQSAPPSAHSAAWLPAVSGPGLVLAAVLAVGTASLV